MENQNYRIKAAMIVFALERCLGDFVRQNQVLEPAILESGAVKKIVERGSVGHDSNRSSRIATIVAASYLEEIINLAIEVSKQTAKADALKKLSSLVAHLDLYGIRNAISHPNRPFPECYWYRTAAIATDPTIDVLEFTAVRQAQQSAEQDRLTPPPDEWLEETYTCIPNNIPGALGHENTGLVGRQTEKRDLIASLRNARYPLLSVVAPGGLGKTALVLDILHDCVADFTTREWCDAVMKYV